MWSSYTYLHSAIVKTNLLPTDIYSKIQLPSPQATVASKDCINNGSLQNLRCRFLCTTKDKNITQAEPLASGLFSVNHLQTVLVVEKKNQALYIVSPSTQQVLTTHWSCDYCIHTMNRNSDRRSISWKEGKHASISISHLGNLGPEIQMVVTSLGQSHLGLRLLSCIWSSRKWKINKMVHSPIFYEMLHIQLLITKSKQVIQVMKAITKWWIYTNVLYFFFLFYDRHHFSIIKFQYKVQVDQH